MNNNFNATKWFRKNFFFISVAVLVVFYLRWFRLTPFVFGNDPTEAFILGSILLFIFLTVSMLLRWITSRDLIFLLGMVNITLLLMNSLYLFIYMPRLETTAKCNGIRYYISQGAPFSDPQWTYVQMSKWKGISYESSFFGYAPGAGANEIICDEKRKEAHFIRTFRDPATLVYIDGENPQIFEGYNSARLKNKLYFMSENWSLQENCTSQHTWECDIFVLALYECDLDYTNCNRLPISYTTDDYDFIDLRPDEDTNQINLVEEYLNLNDETLIFTYGENPVCYVDGCKIETK